MRRISPDAAARQHQQQRRIGQAAARASSGISAAARPPARSADGRHRCSRRPAEPLHRLRLERQQRQHVIDIRRAWRGRGPAATPRPRGRHSRRSGCAAPSPARVRATRWVNSGLSMITSTSGSGRDRRHRRSRECGAEFSAGCAGIAAKPMIARSPSGNGLGHALLRHVGAADAGEAHRALRCRAQRRDQRGAEPVAGFFAGHQKNMRCSRRGPVGPRRSTNSLALSAA